MLSNAYIDIRTVANSYAAVGVAIASANGRVIAHNSRHVPARSA